MAGQGDQNIPKERGEVKVGEGFFLFVGETFGRFDSNDWSNIGVFFSQLMLVEFVLNHIFRCNFLYKSVLGAALTFS